MYWYLRIRDGNLLITLIINGFFSVVMRHVEEEFGQMIPDHSKNSHSFGYIRPTYKETFGSFGVTSMCSVPAIHLQYKDNHCNDSPRYFTCRQVGRIPGHS